MGHKRQILYFKAVIEKPGQPAAPRLEELKEIPSQYMKFTELEERFYSISYDNVRLDPDHVLKTHLTALMRTCKVVSFTRIDPQTLLTSQ